MTPSPLASLLEPLASWSSVSPADRGALHEARLGAAWDRAREFGLGLDFLKALSPALVMEDVAFFHQRAIERVDHAALLEVEAAFPPDGELHICAPYPGTGLLPLPLLFHSDLAAAACADPAHPRRADFDAIFETLFEWSLDPHWLDAPFLADEDELYSKRSATDLGRQAQYRALHFAALRDRVDLMERLIQAGASPDGRAPDGSASPLGETLPCEDGSPLHCALRCRSLPAMSALLEAGADPDFCVYEEDEAGSRTLIAPPPLRFALNWRWPEAADLLLSRGASLLELPDADLSSLDNQPALLLKSSDPLFFLRMRSQLIAERALLTGQEREQAPANAHSDALWRPPSPWFERLALGAAVMLGRPIRLPADRLVLPEPSCPWDPARARLLDADASALRQALLALPPDSPAPAQSIAWLALRLCHAPGQAANRPARLECLRELAEASGALPGLRQDFSRREPEFAGAGFEAAAAACGVDGLIDSLGPLFQELAVLDRGSAELGALSLAVAAGQAEGAQALARARLDARLGHPKLSSSDPGPLALAIQSRRFDLARELIDSLAPFPPEALLRAREQAAPHGEGSAEPLALLDLASLRSEPAPARSPRAPSRRL